MVLAGVNRLLSSILAKQNGQHLVNGMLALGSVGLSHQFQQIRHKHKVKFCGFLEPPAFKQRDIRYKVGTKHDPKRMTWQDFQHRRWKNVHLGKRYPLWQAQLQYAENLCRLGMSTWSVEQVTGLHPHCIQYLERKISGNIVELREAPFSNYVNHKTGER